MSESKRDTLLHDAIGLLITAVESSESTQNTDGGWLGIWLTKEWVYRAKALIAAEKARQSTR